MNRATRTLSRCLVCGFTEIRTDEVIDRGVVLLAECPRCDHRWTERPAFVAQSPAEVIPMHPARVAEVAPAA